MFPQATVLIADDEAICVAITKKLLEQVGIKAISACDGVEALRLYEQHKDEIVLVLLDIQMPRMNGVEAFRRLRKLHVDVKVVVVSGHITASNRNQIEPLCPAGYIEKPLTAEALFAFLKPPFQARSEII